MLTQEKLEPRPGFVVTAWIAEDGAVVVQIDTPEETDDHDTARVYMNDAKAIHWAGPGQAGY